MAPIAQQGQERPAGLFIAGVNPHRPCDDGYRSFVDVMVGQIAAALANVRAYESERQRAEALTALDRAKTAFFSNVSHEFRTPLTLMLGPLDDVGARTDVPADVVEQLRMVRRNGLRLQRLVNTLLDFSRIEAGRAQARFEPVDLNALTRELASSFDSAVDRAGLRLVVDCERINGEVYADRSMWEKIVLNLLSNAFKYTLAGSIEVSLRATGEAVVLRVADTGVGIPHDELPKVFDRFHRIESTRGRSHEGSGIGLALVLELVKLHGGSIGVDSQVGVGTTFTVSMPVGRAHLPAEFVHEAPTESTAGGETTSFVEEALQWVSGSGAAVGEILPASDADPVIGANPGRR